MDPGTTGIARDRILAVAIEQIRRNDGRGLNARQVAQSANVTPAMVNYHLKNRDGLAQACVEALLR